jgi:WD40 repeat protein
MDNKYVSSVEIVGNTGIMGQFGGEIEIVDLSSMSIVQTLKPHMDMVTKLHSIKEKEHNFISTARKDNLSYLWDSRMMKTYVRYF